MADVAADVLEARAIALMREALELFDSGGGSDASAALQHAIDIAERQRPMTEHDIFDSELANRILGPLELAPRGYHLRMGMPRDLILQDAGGPDRSDKKLSWHRGNQVYDRRGADFSSRGQLLRCRGLAAGRSGRTAGATV